MFVTTSLAAILYYTAGYPFGILHPVKWLGNIGGLPLWRDWRLWWWND
jgi:cobalamin biosynthesis protein CobD/CbiB